MSSFIIVLTGFLSIFIIRTYRRSLYNVAGIFTIMWTICLGFSSLGLYGLNKPSFVVVVLGCLSMLIMAFTACIKIRLLSFKTKKSIAIDEETQTVKRPISTKSILLVANIIAYAFSVPYLIKAIRIITAVGMYGLRDVAFNASDYASTTVLIIFQTIIGPLFVATMLLCAIDLSRGFIIKRAIALTIIDVVMYTLLFGGRYMVFQLLVFYAFTMYDGYGKSIARLVVRRKKTVLLIAVLVMVLFFISEQRSSKSAIESLYLYFCGSFSYLSYLIENNIGTNLFLLGKTQFGFIYNFLYLVLSFFTNIDYQGSNHIITQLTQYTVKIGEGVNYNSLGTILHDFMADYGVYGCLFGVFIFGIICRYIEEKKNKTSNSFYYALNVYLLYSAVNSVFGYTFRGPGALVILIYLFVFCRNR